MESNEVMRRGKIVQIENKQVEKAQTKAASLQPPSLQPPSEPTHKYFISSMEEDRLVIDDTIYRRIIALKDIVDEKGNVLVKKGEKGGYVASRKNLSDEGSCWIYDDAIVGEGATICQNARVRNNARVYDNVLARGNSEISDNAQVYNGVLLNHNAQICDNAEVYSSVTLRDNSRISRNAKVHSGVTLRDNSQISDYAEVYDGVSLRGNVRVLGSVKLHGHVELSGDELINSSRQVKSLVNNFSESNRHFSIGQIFKIGPSINISLDSKPIQKANGLKFKNDIFHIGKTTYYEFNYTDDNNLNTSDKNKNRKENKNPKDKLRVSDFNALFGINSLKDFKGKNPKEK